MNPIPTTVMVRVIANGGKFLGADIGGALVTIRNAQTGALLASGNTTGGSGNTTQIMQTPRTWGTPIPTDSASGYQATLNLTEPCLIEVTAYGPIGGLQSANTVSSRHWVLPGVDITDGDGILMVLPGLLVQVIDPPIHDQIAALPHKVRFRAKITMMCGCQLSKGGIWNSDDFYMGVTIINQGTKVADIPLWPADEKEFPSQFHADWDLPSLSQPTYYEAIFYVKQKESCNTGGARVTFFYDPTS